MTESALLALKRAQLLETIEAVPPPPPSLPPVGSAVAARFAETGKFYPAVRNKPRSTPRRARARARASRGSPNNAALSDRPVWQRVEAHASPTVARLSWLHVPGAARTFYSTEHALEPLGAPNRRSL
eukprot:4977685-Prymnesium_polylepis.1